jgi:hypothetical protein
MGNSTEFILTTFTASEKIALKAKKFTSPWMKRFPVEGAEDIKDPKTD